MNYLALRGDVPGPLFLLQNGQPLSRNILTDWLRQIMASARVPGNFSSHSFRIGAATVAARNGVPDHLIQSMGRWSSNAYQLYIRTPAKALLPSLSSWPDGSSCNACFALVSGSYSILFLDLGLGLVSLCRYVVVLLWFSVTGAWGQVGDRRYHVTPVRGSSFLQAPGEGF